MSNPTENPSSLLKELQEKLQIRVHEIKRWRDPSTFVLDELQTLHNFIKQQKQSNPSLKDADFSILQADVNKILSDYRNELLSTYKGYAQELRALIPGWDNQDENFMVFHSQMKNNYNKFQRLGSEIAPDDFKRNYEPILKEILQLLGEKEKDNAFIPSPAVELDQTSPDEAQSANPQRVFIIDTDNEEEKKKDQNKQDPTQTQEQSTTSPTPSVDTSKTEEQEKTHPTPKPSVDTDKTQEPEKPQPTPKPVPGKIQLEEELAAIAKKESSIKFALYEFVDVGAIQKTQDKDIFVAKPELEMEKGDIILKGTAAKVFKSRMMQKEDVQTVLAELKRDYPQDFHKINDPKGAPTRSFLCDIKKSEVLEMTNKKIKREEEKIRSLEKNASPMLKEVIGYKKQKIGLFKELRNALRDSNNLDEIGLFGERYLQQRHAIRKDRYQDWSISGYTDDQRLENKPIVDRVNKWQQNNSKKAGIQMTN